MDQVFSGTNARHTPRIAPLEEATQGADRPFQEATDPAAYVPRGASDRVIDSLQEAIRGGVPGAAIIAPPGFGKTLLLRVVGERLSAGRRTLYLPYAAVALDELCAWTLGLLDYGRAGCPAAALSSLLMAARGPLRRGLVLLVDDAGSMPIDTARDLGRFVRENGGAIQLVLAGADDAHASRVIAALGVDVAIARYTLPFSEEETRTYVRARLERAHVPLSVRDRFGDENIHRIHSLSGGVPRRIHTLADEVARGELAKSTIVEIEDEVRALGSLAPVLPDLERAADWETELD